MRTDEPVSWHPALSGGKHRGWLARALSRAGKARFAGCFPTKGKGQAHACRVALARGLSNLETPLWTERCAKSKHRTRGRVFSLSESEKRGARWRPWKPGIQARLRTRLLPDHKANRRFHFPSCAAFVPMPKENQGRRHRRLTLTNTASFYDFDHRISK